MLDNGHRSTLLLRDGTSEDGLTPSSLNPPGQDAFGGNGRSRLDCSIRDFIVAGARTFLSLRTYLPFMS